MRVLFLLFLTIPIVEIFVLIKVGSFIGVMPTIILVVVTAAIGVTLLRKQGLATLLKAQGKLNSGQVPLSELVDGLFLAVGGALLLTPGFVTDIVGFACLTPGVRHFILANLLRTLKPAMTGFAGTSASASQGEHVIEGEFKREQSDNSQ